MDSGIYPIIASLENKLRLDHREAPLFQTHGVDTPQQLLERELSRLIVDESEDVQQRVKEEFFGWGPLASLIHDPEITEIMINSFDQIWIERAGQISQWNDHFATPHSYHNFLIRLANLMNKVVQVENPVIEGSLGVFRVHYVGPEISPGSAKLCLRRQTERTWGLSDLAIRQWSSPEGISWLKQILGEKKNFMVIGATGSGKTSLINALVKELPPTERVIFIEDTSELRCHNGVSLKLLTREPTVGESLRPFDQSDLLRNALRLRPDRLVLGEVRGVEAKDFLLALSTGHEGSFGALHAHSASQALLRLEMLVQMGAPSWSLQTIRRLIHLSLHYLIVVARKSNGFRYLQGIYQVASLEEQGFTLNTCYQQN